jgi:ketosteroid isomerase-like protein
MKVLFASLLVCFSVIFSQAQTKPPGLPAPQGELLNLLKAWNDAELKGDAAKVAQFLAPEFSFVGGSNRKEYLSLMKPDSSLVIESATIDEAEIQVYGNAAVLTSLNSFKLKKDGRPLEGKFLSLTIWIKHDANWQCVKASMLPAKA